MARAKYQITKDDAQQAYGWLEKKVAGYRLFRDLEPLDRQKAADELEGLWRDAAKLTSWCEQYLGSAEWTQLKNAVRAARKRRGDFWASKKKSVDLSSGAHYRLSVIAKRDGITLSEVIIRYLDKEASEASKVVDL